MNAIFSFAHTHIFWTALIVYAIGFFFGRDGGKAYGWNQATHAVKARIEAIAADGAKLPDSIMNLFS
jgi:hypothetical protein